jgi:hypothetical protein
MKKREKEISVKHWFFDKMYLFRLSLVLERSVRLHDESIAEDLVREIATATSIVIFKL